MASELKKLNIFFRSKKLKKTVFSTVPFSYNNCSQQKFFVRIFFFSNSLPNEYIHTPKQQSPTSVYKSLFVKHTNSNNLIPTTKMNIQILNKQICSDKCGLINVNDGHVNYYANSIRLKHTYIRRRRKKTCINY